MHVIGTAGHVDHGKSTLVHTLTGIDPDRLKEEREREMTIDLGYAWMTLPNGETVSIIDVPGHEDFIRNMLAGVGGIDAALLVIAADDGIMPQTREHVAILDLLQVKNGVIALTKIDLVQDQEWLELVQDDIKQWLAGTGLANFPIVPVSSRTGQGVQELRQTLASLLEQTPPRIDMGQPRLMVDRVFTMAGFGTVVTGTLIDGHLAIGDEVEIQPAQLKARIRGLQTHRVKLQTAVPGSRVAVNLVGVSVDEITRGDVVTRPGWLVPTLLLDARVEVLPDAPGPLRHNMEVAFFAGSAEVPARLRVLGTQEILPGQSGWAQIRFAKPAAIVKRDRFILRLPSPGTTIAGGTAVDPHPERRHRRFRTDVLERLETQAHGTPDEIVLTAIRRKEPCPAKELVGRSGLPAEVVAQTLRELLGERDVITLTGNKVSDIRTFLNGSQTLITATGWDAWCGQLAELLAGFHHRYPLRVAMPLEELRSRLGLDSRLFNEMLALAHSEGRVALTETDVRLPDHQVRFTPQQEVQVAALLAEFSRNPYSPPSLEEARNALGTELLSSLLEQSILVKVSEEICFLQPTYQEMLLRIKEQIKGQGSITLAQARDMFGTTRKYMMPFLEHLDERRITRRVGDDRVLR